MMTKRPNTSEAVTTQRKDPKDSLDYYPTPPWVTRAFCTYVLDVRGLRILDPGCGPGYMVKTLAEFGADASGSDIYDYGAGYPVKDFLAANDNRQFLKEDFEPVDWIVTNPPFNKIEEFLERAFEVATVGVAFFSRIQFLEIEGRYERIWSKGHLESLHIYAERINIYKGVVADSKTRPLMHAWSVFKKDQVTETPTLNWIPPCRYQLQRPEDYRWAA